MDLSFTCHLTLHSQPISISTINRRQSSTQESPEVSDDEIFNLAGTAGDVDMDDREARSVNSIQVTPQY